MPQKPSASNLLSLDAAKIVAGIDVSKDHLDGALYPGHANQRFANTTAGIDCFVFETISELCPEKPKTFPRVWRKNWQAE